MDSPPQASDPEPPMDLKPLSLPNGSLNHHHHALPPPPPPSPSAVYRECMRNHAASLGGHALDGCGEFMPSPSSDPSNPSSLLCAACGCHRNFHRRHRPPPPHPGPSSPNSSSDADDHRRSPSPTAPAPAHMLLALRSGTLSPEMPRKRFRTKFTPEQKERMQALSERLGWRMRRSDEGLVEEKCREIGVARGVFKVWMHNNKHAFLGGASSRRRERDVGNGGGRREGDEVGDAHGEVNGGSGNT